MKNLIIYAASAMFALTACNALDIIPSDSYSDPVVWQDQNLIKMYVNDQYNALVGQDNFLPLFFFSLTRSIKNIMMKDVIISGRIF